MNVPTIEKISDFVKAMPVLGDGEVVCESGPNPYDTRSFHPLYDSKRGFNRIAYERFEHDRDNWNVLGLVNIEEVIVLKKWFKEEAVLWSVGLCLPGSTRHNPTLGPLVFDKESKRRLLNYLERFLRNSDADELSPAQWIGYAKANGGYEFAQCSMISNPQFVALWDIAESTGSRPSEGDTTPSRDERGAGNVAKDGELDTHGMVAWQAEALEHWGEISASERGGGKVSPTTVMRWLKKQGSPDVICKDQPLAKALCWIDKNKDTHSVKLSSIGTRMSEWRKSGKIHAT